MQADLLSKEVDKPSRGEMECSISEQGAIAPKVCQHDGSPFPAGHTGSPSPNDLPAQAGAAIMSTLHPSCAEVLLAQTGAASGGLRSCAHGCRFTGRAA